MGVSVVTAVVTAAKSADLVPLIQLKDDLAITSNKDDDYLKRTISRESAAAAQYCNRVFAVETVTDTIDLQRDAFPYQVPGGVRAVQLSRWPVVTLTSLTENGEALTEGTDFRVDYKSGQVLRLGVDATFVVPWQALPIVVTYSAGYATIPLDVQDAVTRMVKSRYLARTRDPYLKEDDVSGIGRQVFWVSNGTQGNLTPDVSDILDNYRVPVAG